MKITEIINTPENSQGTTSSATTSSAIKGQPTQDIVPQDIVPEQIEGTIEEHSDHSALAEGISQIFS